MSEHYEKYLKYKSKYLNLKSYIQKFNNMKAPGKGNFPYAKMNIIQAENFIMDILITDFLEQTKNSDPHINILRDIKPNKFITSFTTDVHNDDTGYFRDTDFLYTLTLSIDNIQCKCTIKYSYDGHTDNNYKSDANQDYSTLYGWNNTEKETREMFIKNIENLKFNTFSYNVKQ